jgi:bifunctional DNA-binding transcriptional regulator/antitoxin component of YhaV-PrlF toxin-antitoxin module
MVKVVVNKGQYKITIPKELALAKGWTKDSVVRFIETPDGDIILREVKLPKDDKKEEKGGEK